jgi:Short repeat of unknown function (DUF308)
MRSGHRSYVREIVLGGDNKGQRYSAVHGAVLVDNAHTRDLDTDSRRALDFGENTRANVASFFGVYWILTGCLAIRWALAPSRDRIPLVVLVAGLCGLVTGAVVLTRNVVFRPILSTEATIYLVGGTVMLVGLLHFARGFRTELTLPRWGGWDQILLGLLEGVLGASLLTTGVDGPTTDGAITLWSVGGGSSFYWTRWSCGWPVRSALVGALVHKHNLDSWTAAYSVLD